MAYEDDIPGLGGFAPAEMAYEPQPTLDPNVTVGPREENPDFYNSYTGAANFDATRSGGVAGGPPGASAASGWQNPFGKPPERRRMTNPDGTMMSQFQVDMMKKREMSPWALLQQKMLQDQYRRSSADMGDQANRGMMSGWDQMARSGGLSSGGRVALANQAMMARMKGQQGLAGGMSDAMGKNAQQDIQNQLNTDQYNVNNALGESDKEYNAEFDAYEQNANMYSNEMNAAQLEKQAGQKSTFEKIKNEFGNVSPWKWGRD
jgi:hypothetical protein